MDWHPSWHSLLVHIRSAHFSLASILGHNASSEVDAQADTVIRKEYLMKTRNRYLYILTLPYRDYAAPYLPNASTPTLDMYCFCSTGMLASHEVDNTCVLMISRSWADSTINQAVCASYKVPKSCSCAKTGVRSVPLHLSKCPGTFPPPQEAQTTSKGAGPTCDLT